MIKTRKNKGQNEKKDERLSEDADYAEFDDFLFQPNVRPSLTQKEISIEFQPNINYHFKKEIGPGKLQDPARGYCFRHSALSDNISVACRTFQTTVLADLIHTLAERSLISASFAVSPMESAVARRALSFGSKTAQDHRV
ncbi:unnamed protein product [Hermetia illucens]|uniref:Uncharacterized protein n=1 Tax=Hermetia illucens TaxID=343691 RepID=A0A7R8V4X4_HERIL|nr:unnamed protein product [Hermetia illucens]